MEYQSNDINKIEYFNFYQLEYLPIYFAPWWMDAVCGSNNWNVILSKNPDGGIEGVLVYHIKKKWGLPIILMPALTSYNGIWLNYPKGIKNHSKISFEKKVIDKLLVQLPKHYLFFQQLHPDYQNWLPLYWKNYKQTTRYTYYLDLKQDLSLIWDNFKGNIRRNVRKAEESGYQVEESEDYSVFIERLNKSYNQRNKKVPFRLEDLDKVEQACSKRAARKIYLCKNKENRILAGIYLVLDKKTCYYLVGFFDPAFKDYAALTLTLWHGIQEMSKIVERFDFEGSIIPEIEFYFRAFGGKLTPHSKIYNVKNKLIKFLTTLKNPDFFG